MNTLGFGIYLEYINVGIHCYFLRGRAFNTIPKVLVIFCNIMGSTQDKTMNQNLDYQLHQDLGSENYNLQERTVCGKVELFSSVGSAK